MTAQRASEVQEPLSTDERRQNPDFLSIISVSLHPDGRNLRGFPLSRCQLRRLPDWLTVHSRRELLAVQLLRRRWLHRFCFREKWANDSDRNARQTIRRIVDKLILLFFTSIHYAAWVLCNSDVFVDTTWNGPFTVAPAGAKAMTWTRRYFSQFFTDVLLLANFTDSLLTCPWPAFPAADAIDVWARDPTAISSLACPGQSICWKGVLCLLAFLVFWRTLMRAKRRETIEKTVVPSDWLNLHVHLHRNGFL